MIRSNGQVDAKRILIMAAGTGGHVYPALTTAAMLQQHAWKVEWLGTGKGIETRLVPDAGLRLHCVDVVGLRGKSKWSLLLAPWRLFKSLLQSMKVIYQFKPHCVLGMGGFVAGPGGLAAKLMGVPLILHEQNAIPGLTNRLLRPLANVTLQAFSGSFAKGHAITVGNPLRPNIIAKKSEHSGLRILIVGGSLGALALNQVVPEAMALLSPNERPELWHQTGTKHQQETQDIYNKLNVVAQVDAYIDDMGRAYAWADLVICRAGALTISELAGAGMGSILVPYPYAVDDHQTANANILVRADAAILMPQTQLSALTLSQNIRALQSHPLKLVQMAAAALTCAAPQAADKVAQHCMEIARG
ncbi:MAG: undecaprenyldiphospho-muramoylpentapeptide beta-N-acetylglucosaminyltransferase [Gammaproteobacteria bacterium]|jgi:UDP-N-acetylglucosamine--N-acetylmuramyl-(pentapeptide) pyrophosphoryl-undecaprenol N-acetylglucosamine transferase